MKQQEHQSSNLTPSAKQTPKLQRRTVAILVAAIIGIVIYMGLIVEAVNSDSSIKPATSTPPPQVLLDLTSNDSKTTQKFTAAGAWDLYWSYDCTASRAPQSNFIIEAINSDATISTVSLPINQLGAKHSGVEHYNTGGTFYLTIISKCHFRVTAKG